MVPLIHAFRVFDNFYVFDANANSILALDEAQWRLAQEIEQGTITEEGQALIDSFQKRNYFHPPDIREIKHPETDTLQHHLDRKIQKLTLQVTQHCNLRCEYCVYSGMYQTRTHEHKSMSFELAKQGIDYVLERSIDERKINFSFYGGEPLLELELIEKCISYIQVKCKGRDVTLGMTTNGTLLTPDIYERLEKHKINFLVSLDGPKEIHDSARKYPDGRGSYDDIMNNVTNIHAKYPNAKDLISFMAVATPDMDDTCIDRFYKMEEILPYYNVSMSFLSDTYTDQDTSFGEKFSSLYTQERAKLFLYMLGKIKEDKVSRLITEDISKLRAKYTQLKRIEKLSPICHPGGPCLAGVHRLFLSVDGIFYPCERVSETSEPMKIGDIENGIDVEKANAINNIGIITEEECKACWAILHCAMCGAHADNLITFSKEKRLDGCGKVKQQVEDSFKDVCFLKMHGYDFEDKY